MRFITDFIIALTFWSFATYSTVQVYQFFRETSVKQIRRGLNPTLKFTEALLQDKK